MPVKNDSRFRHLKADEKDYKRSDSGGLFMLVTNTGSKLWRHAYSFDAKQKLLAIGQYPLVSLADARTKRGNAKKLLADGAACPIVVQAQPRRAPHFVSVLMALPGSARPPHLLNQLLSGRYGANAGKQ